MNIPCMCEHKSSRIRIRNSRKLLIANILRRTVPYSWKCVRNVKFCSLWFWQQSTNIIATKNFGMRYICEVSTMPLLHYFFQMPSLPFSGSVPSLMPEVLHKANQRVSILSREPDEVGPGAKRAKNTCTWCN